MHPTLEKIDSDFDSSITVKREISPYMDYPFHYHPEYEIIFVQKSHGLRLMGNHVSNFSDGDLVFIGSGLPHVWRNDRIYYQGDEKLKVDVFVIHFLYDALGKDFFNLPELSRVKKLFLLGRQGLRVKGKDRRRISGLIQDVYNSSGMDRLVTFMKILSELAETREYELLSAQGYSDFINKSDSDRINKVMNYCMDNYNRDISLDEISDFLNLNESSFCRYFKYRTFKTFSQFLNEIRIAKACKFLVETEMTVTQICYECGYNNISHFNRQFKLIMGTTAREYAKRIAL